MSYLNAFWSLLPLSLSQELLPAAEHVQQPEVGCRLAGVGHILRNPKLAGKLLNLRRRPTINKKPFIMNLRKAPEITKSGLSLRVLARRQGNLSHS